MAPTHSRFRDMLDREVQIIAAAEAQVNRLIAEMKIGGRMGDYALQQVYALLNARRPWWALRARVAKTVPFGVSMALVIEGLIDGKGRVTPLGEQVRTHEALVAYVERLDR